MVAVTNWGDALKTSVANALSMFLGAIPKIIAFVLILIIGWFIASLIAKAITALLHSVKFNDLAQKAGLTSFVEDMGVKTDASTFVATVVKWFVRLIVLIVAFDALGLPAVDAVLQRFLLFIPNLIVALVVLVIGGLAAQALKKLVQGAAKEASLGNPDLLGTIASVTVWAFAIIIAVDQIGVATTVVNTLFMGLVGALALALGLAFGLGGRDTAGQIVSTWYEKGKEAAPKMAKAADAAQQQAKSSTGAAPSPESFVQERRPVS